MRRKSSGLLGYSCYTIQLLYKFSIYYFSFQPVIHKANFDICAKKLRKISCEIFHRKNYFTWFLEFFYNLLPKIASTCRSPNKRSWEKQRGGDALLEKDFVINRKASLSKRVGVDIPTRNSPKNLYSLRMF